MLDLLPDLRRWHEADTDVALAVLVEVRGSAPRGPGAAMAVGADGAVAGSVSGGCVEGALYEAAQEVLADGVPRLLTYGVSDASAFAVGLTCGGTLRVFVRAYRGAAERAALLDDLAPAARGEPLVLATVVEAAPGGPDPGRRMRIRGEGDEGVEGDEGAEGAVTGSLGDPGLDRAVRREALGRLADGRSALSGLGRSGERREEAVAVFLHCWAPPPRMLVFGAIDHAAATARIGSFLGYRVTVCDARPVFATPERFPMADEVVCRWPSDYLAATTTDSRTAICVLTHDPKFDVPLILAALRTPAAYIGVMGSRRTDADRRARLREAGVSEAELARLSAPIGLDLGARTPEETAVAIAAEIVQLREDASGARLSAGHR